MDGQYIMGEIVHEFTVDDLIVSVYISAFPRTIRGELVIKRKNSFNFIDEFLFITKKNGKLAIEWPEQINWSEGTLEVTQETKNKITEIVFRIFEISMFW